MEWDEKTLQYIYKKNLKEEVKDKIIYHKYYIDMNNQIDILQILINVVIKLDNQIYERRLKRNSHKGCYLPQGQSRYDRPDRRPKNISVHENLSRTYSRRRIQSREDYGL